MNNYGSCVNKKKQKKILLEDIELIDLSKNKKSNIIEEKSIDDSGTKIFDINMMEQYIFGSWELSHQEKQCLTKDIFDASFIKSFAKGDEQKIKKLCVIISKRVETFQSQSECDDFIDQCELEAEQAKKEKNELKEGYCRKLSNLITFLYSNWLNIRQSPDINKLLDNDLKADGAVPTVPIEGLQYQGVDPAKNSFYKAVCCSYHGYQPRGLRNFVASHIRNNSGTFSTRILKNGYKSVDGYADNVRSNEAKRVDEPEIIALMMLLERPIVIVNRDGEICDLSLIREFEKSLEKIKKNEKNEKKGNDDPIFILYHADNYNGLLLKKNYNAKKVFKSLIKDSKVDEFSQENELTQLSQAFAKLQQKIHEGYKKVVSNYIEYTQSSCIELFNKAMSSGAAADLQILQAFFTQCMVNQHILTTQNTKNIYDHSLEQKQVYRNFEKQLKKITDEENEAEKFEEPEKEKEKEELVIKKSEKEKIEKELRDFVKEKYKSNIAANAPEKALVVIGEDLKQLRHLSDVNNLCSGQGKMCPLFLDQNRG